MPYAKKFKHEWNKQWFDSPFVRYLAMYCKASSRKVHKKNGMKLLAIRSALKAMEV